MSKGEKKPVPVEIDYFRLKDHEELSTDRSRELYDQCDGLFKAWVVSADGAIADYQAGDELQMPIQTIQARQYQLARASDGVIVSYGFHRPDISSNKAGFQVDRNTQTDNLITILSARDPDAPIPEAGEKYDDQVKQAQKFLLAYAKRFGYSPEQLKLYAAYDIDNLDKLPVDGIEKFKENALRVIMSAFSRPNFTDGVDKYHSERPFPNRTKLIRDKSRHFSAGRLALASLVLPLPGFSKPMIQDSVLSVDMPWEAQILDNVINESLHQREAYDREHVELPADMPTIDTLGDTPAISPRLALELQGAPTITDNGSSQPLAGGVRRLINLGNAGSDDHLFHGTYLAPNECDAYNVNMGIYDGLRIANITPVVASDLEFLVDPNQIEVCNVSQQNIHPSDLEDIFVQEVPRV
jgi:hypothetical protein